MFVGVVGPYFCIALLASAIHLFPGLTFVICNHQTNHVRSVITYEAYQLIIDQYAFKFLFTLISRSVFCIYRVVYLFLF